MRSLMEKAGYKPDTLSKERSLAKVLAGVGVKRTGEPRETPAGWDDQWEEALSEWMSVENLEERMTGWIDPRVLERLRLMSAS